jgi:hypothetical protein
MGLIDLIKELIEKKLSLEVWFKPIHNDWKIRKTIRAWKDHIDENRGSIKKNLKIKGWFKIKLKSFETRNQFVKNIEI